jgi:bacterioferritin
MEKVWMLPRTNTIQSWPFVRREGVEGSAMTLRGKADVERVTGLLNEALATEIISILRYKRHYFMTTGFHSRHVKAKFLQHVAEEQAHADQLAERIVQLGSEPDLSLERLLNRSQSEHVPGDSLVELLTADLLAERGAIDSYRGLIACVGVDDPTTRKILERILAQEEEHAEALASLLRV